MRKWAVYLVVLLSLLPFSEPDLRAQTDGCEAAAGEPMVLGAIFPTGDLFSVSSNESLQGAEAMRQAINVCGGVDGRPVEWLYGPAVDRYEAADAVAALVAEGVPLIVGSGATAVHLGATEAAQAAAVMYWEVSEPLTVAGDWIFTTRPTAEQLGWEAANFVQSEIPDARVALIHESRELAQQVAGGVLDGLTDPPVIEMSYDDALYDAYTLAQRIRDEDIDVVILAAFDRDGNRLWYALRDADANIDAWLHIGSEGYRRDLCARALNIEAFMSVSAVGNVDVDYREAVLGVVYDEYLSTYLAEYSTQPSDEADLSAAGVYLLLHHVLPAVEGDYTAENIREAALNIDFDSAVGMMGEGIVFGDESSRNEAASVLIRQQQGQHFCSLFPADIATCSGSIVPFPTWRERALEQERGIVCNPET
jgi:branched-chain amino acid transport system substrate-binding protein